MQVPSWVLVRSQAAGPYHRHQPCCHFARRHMARGTQIRQPWVCWALSQRIDDSCLSAATRIITMGHFALGPFADSWLEHHQHMLLPTTTSHQLPMAGCARSQTSTPMPSTSSSSGRERFKQHTVWTGCWKLQTAAGIHLSKLPTNYCYLPTSYNTLQSADHQCIAVQRRLQLPSHPGMCPVCMCNSLQLQLCLLNQSQQITSCPTNGATIVCQSITARMLATRQLRPCGPLYADYHACHTWQPQPWKNLCLC